MSAPDAAPVTFQIASAVVAGATIAVIVLLWVTREFSKTRSLMYRIMSRHNREDDDRFAHLDAEVWKLHVRNAIKDGIPLPERRPLPRRRYLMDDSGDEEAGGAAFEPAE